MLATMIVLLRTKLSACVDSIFVPIFFSQGAFFLLFCNFHSAFMLLFFAFLLHLLFQGAFSNRISGAFVLLLVHILINPGFHRLCLLKTDLMFAEFQQSQAWTLRQQA